MRSRSRFRLAEPLVDIGQEEDRAWHPRVLARSPWRLALACSGWRFAGILQILGIAVSSRSPSFFRGAGFWYLG